MMPPVLSRAPRASRFFMGTGWIVVATWFTGAVFGSPTNGLVGHWPLDGATANNMPEGREGRIQGGTTYEPSPVDVRGQALLLNGVDGCIKFDVATSLQATSDLTVAAWVLPLTTTQAGIFRLGPSEDTNDSWSVYVLPQGVLQFESPVAAGARKTFQSAPGIFLPDQWYHVAARIAHSSTGITVMLVVNGRKVAEGLVSSLNPGPSHQLVLTVGQGRTQNSFLHGLVDDVRIFATALDIAQLKELGRGGRLASAPRPVPFAGKFELETNEVVVLAGGANVVAAQHLGYLEMLLTAATPTRRPRFRTLAWEADTVFEQWRILNFGGWEHQLQRAAAGTIIAQFGQIEVLREPAPVDEFIQAYDGLLSQFENVTPRIILVSPALFEPGPPSAPNLTRHNSTVVHYAEAIGELARRRGYLFVDLTKAPRTDKDKLTSNGLHLTPEGQWWVAAAIASQLAPNHDLSKIKLAFDGVAVEPAPFENLRAALVAKNRLWFDYWRPMNWAFLYGDRTEQASSRDHREPRARWFPEELRRFLPLIRKAELEIDTLATAALGGNAP